MIPALIRKMVGSTDEVVLWGDGSPSREFLYVDDCVEGLLLAAEHYDGAEPVNLGTGVETTIRELAETIADVTGFEGEIVWDTSMPNGQPRRSLDASRAAGAVRLPRRHVPPARDRAHRRLVPRARARGVTPARALAPFVALALGGRGDRRGGGGRLRAGAVVAAAPEPAPARARAGRRRVVARADGGRAGWLVVAPLAVVLVPVLGAPLRQRRSCATRTSTAFSPRRSVSRTAGGAAGALPRFSPSRSS